MIERQADARQCQSDFLSYRIYKGKLFAAQVMVSKPESSLIFPSYFARLNEARLFEKTIVIRNEQANEKRIITITITIIIIYISHIAYYCRYIVVSVVVEEVEVEVVVVIVVVVVVSEAI